MWLQAGPRWAAESQWAAHPWRQFKMPSPGWWVGCPGQSGEGLVISPPGLLQPCHLPSLLVLPGTSP